MFSFSKGRHTSKSVDMTYLKHFGEILCNWTRYVPEAGWALVDLLDKEGRVEEAHCLGMRMHEVETDARDRVRILLEMSRLDIEIPDPLSQVELFEPLVRQHPEHLALNLMLGLALTRVNRSEEGLKLLEEAYGITLVLLKPGMQG